MRKRGGAHGAFTFALLHVLSTVLRRYLSLSTPTTLHSAEHYWSHREAMSGEMAQSLGSEYQQKCLDRGGGKDYDRGTQVGIIFFYCDLE